MFALHELSTGKLTGTPTTFSRQSRTSVNKNPLYKPLGGRPQTSPDSLGRVSHSEPGFAAGSRSAHSRLHGQTTPARDCRGHRSYGRSSTARGALPSSYFALRDDAGSVSASVVLADGCGSDRRSPRRPPHSQGGRVHQRMLHLPLALHQARRARAVSSATDFLPVAQPPLGGVPVPVACTAPAPVCSALFAGVSFSPSIYPTLFAPPISCFCCTLYSISSRGAHLSPYEAWCNACRAKGHCARHTSHPAAMQVVDRLTRTGASPVRMCFVSRS